MNEIDVNQYLILDKFIQRIYRGVISSNELYKIDKSVRSLYIVNTDPNYLPGSHWICIYSQGEICEIFDSLGNNPKEYTIHFTTFIQEYEKCTYSTVKLQSDTSNVCGIYCIFYSYLKSRGFELTEILNTFSENTQMNDCLMRDFLDRVQQLHSVTS